MIAHTQYIRWFEDISNDDVAFVGGKNASLGEMYKELAQHNVLVPNGFAVTADAYRFFLADAGINAALEKKLSTLDSENSAQLAETAAACRALVTSATLPATLVQEIRSAYAKLEQQYGASMSVAVRSSATAEDLPEASFAGQHDSFLNVHGVDAALTMCRLCFASLFTDRAIVYRERQGIKHMDVALSVGVMKMVRADVGASGVIFTIDTESGHDQFLFLTAAYGLGENIVKGAVDPDEFYVHKPTFMKGYRHVLRRRKGKKEIKMVYADDAQAATTCNVDTSDSERRQYAISDDEVIHLSDYALKIEQHYSDRAGHRQAMDIEWARDGIDGQLYIVQARPETVHARRRKHVIEHYKLDVKAQPLLQGHAIGAQIASGKARVIRNVNELNSFEEGEILVADMTSPDWGSVMARATALVTNRGGRTCHAAIVARELGVVAVVGCGDATERIKTGDMLTVDCSAGENGKVFGSALPFSVEQVDVTGLARPRTKIMLNLGDPARAMQAAMLPNDGVGLARMEFIITDYVGAHPMALVNMEQVSDPAVKQQLISLTLEYPTPTEYFISKLAEGIGTIAAAFYPKPVIVRLSDFKTNEYAALLGGEDFEAAEANPMIGFRGAARYIHPNYAAGFALECAALKRVREDMGLVNVRLMVPFCRRINEAQGVLASLASHGLERGQHGLEIYVMCEIPNNVILIDEFARYFDGFSIGSNDLTQLTLGIDRDSDILAEQFDERDPGVKEMCRLAIQGAKRNGKHCGICGQAPSDYPEMAAWLVEQGIDSLSLNPDSVLKVTRRVLDLEKVVSDKPKLIEEPQL